ncbi:MAG: glycogen debranching enzyme, partial [Spirochaetaceae bacterium]|nr:glycogen debranching enzyme [Spirochaetaceae bacterium]
ENGEDNHDGADINWSCNHGVEGETADPVIQAARNRQVKNYLATLLLSVGTPMLLGGDELRRTQRGNNNAYCQDNEISWYDWSLLQPHADIWRFCRELVAFRKNHAALRRQEFFTGQDRDHNSLPDIAWYDEHKKTPDWSSISLTLAALIDGSKAETGDIGANGAYGADSDCDFYFMFNASVNQVDFQLPRQPRGKPWQKVVDTAAEAPYDIIGAAPYGSLPSQKSCIVAASSFVLLVAEG